MQIAARADRRPSCPGGWVSGNHHDTQNSHRDKPSIRPEHFARRLRKGRRTRILPLARAFARPAIVILEKPTAARLVVEEPSYPGTATSTLPPDKDPRASGGIHRRTSSHPALAGLAPMVSTPAGSPGISCSKAVFRPVANSSRLTAPEAPLVGI